MPERYKFINRDISWLSFNDRVLQEAEDSRVPLIERIKFLGIYSANSDEFFRVRVASLKRMADLGGKTPLVFGGTPQKILGQIQETVIRHRHAFDKIYLELLEELEKHKIFMINEKQLSPEQARFVRNYFHLKVRPSLVPIMIESAPEFPILKDKMIYLGIKLSKKDNPEDKKYALIEVPTDIVSRFLVLPDIEDKHYIIILDDVIRYCLNEIFSIFEYDTFEAYTIKVTRDAELDLDDDVSESLLNKISKSLKQRKRGRPVRFIYDEEMPLDMLKFLMRKLHLRKGDNVTPGARYHNFKDFIKFPDIDKQAMHYQQASPVPHRRIGDNANLFRLIQQKDILLQYPYHSFDHTIDLLREAAIDPQVVSIKITLYRLAEYSNVINALINAMKNGKAVTATVELQARFDEEANIYWANKLREEGAKVIFGVPGLKVHSKLCLITRVEKRKQVQYAYVATGNFNESTARMYSDHALMTADPRLTSEIEKVFSLFDNFFKTLPFKHLLVSPYYMRSGFLALIDKEIKNAKAGKDAYMTLKLNSLVDEEMIKKLYTASIAGVKINLIVRGICSLKPGVSKMSENISVISIVDKYLEHSRIFVFCNDGKEKIFISSSDWMNRNLDYRIEVACPIYDEDIKQELRDFLNLQLKDNTKARIIDKEQTNVYKKTKGPKIRAQQDMYRLLTAPLNGKGNHVNFPEMKTPEVSPKTNKLKKEPVLK